MAELHLRPRRMPAGEFRLRVYLYEKGESTDTAGNPITTYTVLARSSRAYKRTLLTKELPLHTGEAEQHSTHEIGVKWTGYNIKAGWRVEIRYRGSRPNETYRVQTAEDYDGRGLYHRLRVSPVAG